MMTPRQQEPAGFTCDQCGEGPFKSAHALKIHVIRKHSEHATAWGRKAKQKATDVRIKHCPYCGGDLSPFLPE